MVATVNLSELTTNTLAEIVKRSREGVLVYGLTEIVNALKDKNVERIRQVFGDGGTRMLLGEAYTNQLEEIRVVDDLSEQKELLMVLCARDFW